MLILLKVFSSWGKKKPKTKPREKPETGVRIIVLKQGESQWSTVSPRVKIYWKGRGREDQAKHVNTHSVGDLHKVIVSASATHWKAKSPHKTFNYPTTITPAPLGGPMLLTVHCAKGTPEGACALLPSPKGEEISASPFLSVGHHIQGSAGLLLYCLDVWGA